MKKIFKSLVLTAAVVSFSACSDFLNQQSSSELTDDIVYESTYYTSLAVNKVYGGLTQDQTYSQYIPIVWGLNSDCELVDGMGSNSTNTSSERGNMNYNANPGWANLARIWDAMYGVIENANLVVAGVSNSSLIHGNNADARTMLRFKGEALTLRAMLYFDMIRFFGDIPMKMEPSQSDLSNAYIPKSNRDEIMDRLIADLEEAIEYLPWADAVANYTTEHVTKGYAHSLLANIALTRAGWNIREAALEGYETATFSDATYPTQRCDAATRTKMYELALSHLAVVINNGTHKVNPSFENQWYLLNQRKLDQTYRENIFEIPMGLNRSGELGYTVGVRISGGTAYYGAQGNSSGKMKLTAPYFWSFDARDTRRDITCAHYELKEESGVLKEVVRGNNPFEIYVGKWDPRKMSEEWRQAALSIGQTKLMTGINTVRMRYSQVLLMYAEVMNELQTVDAVGPAGLSARQALAIVHTRAFAERDKAAAQAYVDAIPGDKESFFAAIVDENAWELAGEGVRKFDLIRWNLLSAKIDQFKNDYQNQLTNEYPKKVYFNYKDEAKSVIDMASVQWYAEPDSPADFDDNKTFWGTYSDTQVLTNLPAISAGLNSSVVNRYLLPIGSTTISASNGTLQNSYGYSN